MHRFAVKLYATDHRGLTAEDVVPVFHSWIQQQSIPGHLLIDVSDYDHVHDGPGTLLVAHEANISTDRGGGRPGLLYARKQPAEGNVRQRIEQALGAALRAAAMLEQDPRLAGRVSFATNDLALRINDRLSAPNTAQTFAALRDDVAAAAQAVLGSPVTLTHEPNERGVLEIKITTPAARPLGALAPAGA